MSSPLDGAVLLDGHQLGDDVLVLGGLVLGREDVVALHLPDDGEAVDLVPSPLGGHRAGVVDLVRLVFFPFPFPGLGLLLVPGVLGFAAFFAHGWHLVFPADGGAVLFFP